MTDLAGPDVPAPSGDAATTARTAGTARRRSPGGTRRRRSRRRWPAVLALLVACLLLWPVISLGQALAAPGTDTAVARTASWARDHRMGGVVTTLEQWQYALDPPRSGGVPDAGALPTGRSRATHPMSAPPPTIPSQAGAALPGEGEWRPLYSSGGRTAAMVAALRPDAVHTSYVAHVVWMDPKLNSFVLHPGTKEPGRFGQQQSQLTGTDAATVLASFNGGFKMANSKGGYWQDGTTVAPLRKGAASMVFGTDGTLKVESWPGGQPAAGVAAVRQNLTLLVDKGRVTPAVADPSAAVWGKTIGNAAAVWRSGIGTRADGSVVAVVGPSLTIGALAQILRDAGAVEAMQLDINKNWTSYITYTHDQNGTTPKKLTDDEVAAADRYLQASSRDLVAVMPRRHG